MIEERTETAPKIAVSDSLWSKVPGFEALSILPALGVEGIIVTPSNICRSYADMKIDKRVITGYSRILSDLEIKPVALRGIVPADERGQIFGEKERQKVLLDRVRYACGVAAELGAGSLSFSSPELRNGAFVSNPGDLDVAVSFLDEVALYAREEGVQVTLESCPTSLGCDMGTTLGEVAEILSFVEDARGLGIHMNVSSLLMEEEMPKASIAAHGASSQHIEVCDPFFRVMSDHHAVGHEAIASALGRLRLAGYGPKWISVSGRLEGADGKFAATTGVIGAIQKVRACYLDESQR